VVTIRKFLATLNHTLTISPRGFRRYYSGERKMLVLSRKQGQTIVIDNNIRVAVLNIKGKVARLGIEAPNDVLILREELVLYDNVRLPSTDISEDDYGEPSQIAELGALI
jgi:carbon storage regulator